MGHEKRVVSAVALVVAVGLAALVGTRYAKADYNDPDPSSSSSSSSSATSSDAPGDPLSDVSRSSADSSGTSETSREPYNYGISASTDENCTITGQPLKSRGTFYYDAGTKYADINLEADDIMKVNRAVNALNEKVDGTTGTMNTALTTALANEVADRTLAIANESQKRETALTNLENATNDRISAEEQARIAAMNEEAATRAEDMKNLADSTNERLTAEEQARGEAVTNLQNYVINGGSVTKVENMNGVRAVYQYDEMTGDATVTLSPISSPVPSP